MYGIGGVLQEHVRTLPRFGEGRSSISDVLALDDGRFVVSDQRSGELHVFKRLESARGVRASSDPSCAFSVDKQASQQIVQVGEPISITLDVDGNCPSRSGTDFVLLMQFAEKRARAGTISIPYARDFIEAVDYSVDRVGIVGANFRYGSTIVRDLGSDRASLMSGIDELLVPPKIGISSTRGVGYAATQNLFDGDSGRSDSARVIVAFSTGWTQPGTIVRDTIYAKGRGTRISAIMDIDPGSWSRVKYLERDTSQLLLRYIASGWWDFHEAGSYELDGAAELYGELADDGAPFKAEVLSQVMVVTDTLPSNIEYVPQSAIPPAVWDGGRRMLTWSLEDTPIWCYKT